MSKFKDDVQVTTLRSVKVKCLKKSCGYVWHYMPKDPKRQDLLAHIADQPGILKVMRFSCPKCKTPAFLGQAMEAAKNAKQ